MANQNLFRSEARRPAKATAVNRAGGKAFSRSAKNQLATYACTGSFHNTFYASARTQLKDIQEVLPKVDSEFVAKVAIYARKHGWMKDMPAFLVAELAARVRSANYELAMGIGDEQVASRLESLHYQAFTGAIDVAKMARNYVQFLRSGVFGFSSLPRVSRRMIKHWLTRSKPEYLFRHMIGNDPSLADIIRIVRPKPTDHQRSVLYQYIIGKEDNREGAGMFSYAPELLPELVRAWEDFKTNPKGIPPDVPFDMLSSLQPNTEQWKEICRNAPYMMTRMNLNTFARHGVFNDAAMVKLVAARLRDEELIRKARQFPYQFLTAYQNMKDVPKPIINALQDAMEIALGNIPTCDANLIIVCPDVSGSMGSYTMGDTKDRRACRNPDAVRQTKCVDVAAMFASAMLRANEDTCRVIAVDTALYDPKLNPRDSIMSNTQKLVQFGGGGTNLSLPLRYINKQGLRPDLVVFISDNESWADRWGSSTGSEVEWGKIRQRHKRARMVRIDLVPSRSTQVSKDHKDILNVAGFSDLVFNVIGEFLRVDLDSTDPWSTMIENTVQLDRPRA